MEFTDITKNLVNGANMGGIAMKVYFGLWADVLTWPTEPAAPADLAAAGKLTANLIMKDGKRAFELYVTDDTGEFKIEPVGEVDGKSYIMHLTVFNPGLQAKLLGFMNSVKNENLFFIVPNNNGQFFLMGDAFRAAIYAGAPDGAGTAKETAGRSGISMEFVYKCKNVYEYLGSVPLTPAVNS